MANMRACNMRYLFGATVVLDEGEGGVHDIGYFNINFEMFSGPDASAGAVYIGGVTEGRHTLSVQRDGQEFAKSDVMVQKDALSFLDLLPMTADYPGASPGP